MRFSNILRRRYAWYGPQKVSRYNNTFPKISTNYKFSTGSTFFEAVEGLINYNKYTTGYGNSMSECVVLYDEPGVQSVVYNKREYELVQMHMF